MNSPRRLAHLVLLGFLNLVPVGRAATAPAWHTSPAASVLVSGGSMMNGERFADSTLAVMREHYAGCKKVALVLHATLPAERDRMERRLQEAFRHLVGAAAESLHRRDAAGALALLEEADGIFVGGGETFVLLGELHRTGQLEVIRRRVAAGVPYGGSSAGANVAGLLIGTTNDFPVAEIPTRTALGVFPAVINPHHPTPDTEAEFKGRAGKIEIYLQFNPEETVLGLANASIARLHAGQVTLVTGRGWLYRGKASRELKIGEPVPELTTEVGRTSGSEPRKTRNTRKAGPNRWEPDTEATALCRASFPGRGAPWRARACQGTPLQMPVGQRGGSQVRRAPIPQLSHA